MTTTEKNKALVRRFYEEIDKGNLEAMDELVAEDYLDHNPPPFPGLAPGREGVKQAFRIFWEATPGHHEIEDQIAEGDKVVARTRFQGRHTGNFQGIPPTNKPVDFQGFATFRIANGKIAEHWADFDAMGMMQQLGVIPTPGS